MIDREMLVEDVRARAGLERRGDVDRALRAVLGALADTLDRGTAEAIARELPSELADVVRAGGGVGSFDIESFFERVGRRVGEGVGFAREHASAVCAALAHQMPGETRHRIERAYPEFAAQLFARAEAATDEPPVHIPPVEHATLATGRPGSTHPLSEARPERAQSHSVVREANPHGATKLSSATGTLQERERDTLATGRPGSKRPISEH